MKLHRRHDPVEQRFVEQILDHCRDAGVTVRTRPGRTIGKRMSVSGSFDGSTMLIARDGRFWFETLIHEYCHLLQKLDGSEWFTPAGNRHWGSFDDWLIGKSNPPPARILRCTRVIQACELDCERRAAAFIRRHRFPSINLDEYIIAANAYVFGYEAARLLRRWHNKQRPYWVPEIHRMMPTTFISEKQFGKLPAGYLEAYVRRCLKLGGD